MPPCASRGRQVLRVPIIPKMQLIIDKLKLPDRPLLAVTGNSHPHRRLPMRLHFRRGQVSVRDRRLSPGPRSVVAPCHIHMDIRHSRRPPRLKHVLMCPTQGVISRRCSVASHRPFPNRLATRSSAVRRPGRPLRRGTSIRARCRIGVRTKRCCECGVTPRESVKTEHA